MRSDTWQRSRLAQARTRGRSRLLAVALLAALAASLLALAPGASASRSQSSLFDLAGTGLDSSPAQRAAALDQLKTFGVDTVRVVLPWNRIAPSPDSAAKPAFDASDPNAYPQQNWAGIDDLVRGAASRGMEVLLDPSSPLPIWGSTNHSDIGDPVDPEFQQFVQALGNRYSGSFVPPGSATALPRVTRWSVGNEANLTLFLKPQFKHRRSVSGGIYRDFFLAAQQGLANSGHGGDRLLIGETSPGPGRKGTDPVTFMRGVFCLNRKFKRRHGCSPIHADGWAQHPYDPNDPPFKANKGLINLATIGRLTKALDRARQAHAVNRRLPIYVTEYGVESVPDRKFGVSQLRQAEYISISEYLMYLNRRIRSFGQYLLQDDSGNAQVNFQTGLQFADGRHKVSYEAYQIALVAQRANKKKHTVKIWGHVRPDGGPFEVTVQARGGGPAQTLKHVHTDSRGYFQFRTPFRKGRRYSASTRLPDGTELSGPFVRTYVFN